MRKIYTIFLLLLSTIGYIQAQCNLLSNAVPGIFLDYQSTNLFNCSGVAYNPIQAKYYAVRAGNSSFPLETWSSTGTQLYTTSAGFDWRGMWWNPNTNQLEGNGYNTFGMWRANLDVSGNALSTGVSLFTGMAQPDAQSCGDYDPIANEVIYYFNGRIYRYSRATNAAINNYALIGCPVGFGNINSTTVVYTGCVGKEIGILDYVNKRIYLFQKNTGIYMGMCQLPAAAVTSNSFRFSWANGYAWLFDLNTGNWYSYRIFDTVLPDNTFSATANWVTASAAAITWESSSFQDYERFEVERSLDAVEFTGIGGLEADSYTNDVDGRRQWSLQDGMVPTSPVIYYRVKISTLSGETHYSDVLTLTRVAEEGIAMGAWPVPASESIQVRFQGVSSGSQLTIVDAAGRIVLQENVSGEVALEGWMKLDCSGWADGVYVMRMQDEQGRNATQRLVVKH
jgi:hypothetical protein